MTDNQAAAEFAYRIVTIIGTLGALIIVVVAILLGRRAMRKPKQIPLAADERRLGEMYGKTSDVSLGGFIATGSASEGKLVLTSKQLIYTRYDEKRHALTISPGDLISVEVGEKGLLIKRPTLRITFNPGVRKKPKAVTWVVPEKATIAGNPLVFMRDRSYDNPNTATTFAALLEKWRAGTANSDASTLVQVSPETEDIKGRMLCSDGSCIGVIGADGRCKVCGKPCSDDGSV